MKITRLSAAVLAACSLLACAGCPVSHSTIEMSSEPAYVEKLAEDPNEAAETKSAPTESSAAAAPAPPSGDVSLPSEQALGTTEPAAEIAQAGAGQESTGQEKPTPKAELQQSAQPAADANPGARPKADRTPRKPGEPLKITFDNIIIGMQADVVFRPWMLKEEVKELEGDRISITGVMHGAVEGRKFDNFILLRNRECKFGPGGQADHLADVKLAPGAKTSYTGDTVRVEGTLHIEPFTGGDGNTWSIYEIRDAKVTVQ